MEPERVVDMFKFISTTWPMKADKWLTDESVMEGWAKALEEYSDGLVGQAVHDLVRTPGRDQQWPFSLAELLTQIERTRQYHGQFGREL
jgi:hypothetical protein